MPSQQHTEILEQEITTEVIEELLSSCSDCNDIIDMQSLDCASESVILIYRARLEGTSQKDSGSLINLIKTWVSSGPSFIVNELLVMVDSQCTLVISSLSEGECMNDPTAESTTSDTNSNSNTSDTTPSSIVTSSATAAIIGAVVIVIIIIIGVVVALVIMSRHTHGDETINKQ